MHKNQKGNNNNLNQLYKTKEIKTKQLMLKLL